MYILIGFVSIVFLFAILSISAVFIIIHVNFIFRKYFGMHAWKYRNPHNRTCVKCKRQEVEHYFSWNKPSQTFWDVFKEGNGNKFSCKKQ